jgi:putative ABC transport system permease protein
MLKNYLVIAWRNLGKNKTFSFINILGLTIGITVCLMIFLFIMNEFSMDKFHRQGDRIYRVMRKYDGSGPGVPYLSAPYAPALLNDFPGEIKKAVRVMPTNGLIVFDNNSFNEKKMYVADADFFSLFSFPLVRGNSETALKDPASVVLTETTAKRYFGSVDRAMGKVIEMDRDLPLKVTGIAQDIPSNSHLNFDLVVPMSIYSNKSWMTSWMNNSLFTYVLLDAKTREENIETRLGQFVLKHMGTEIENTTEKFTLLLNPLKSIYFEPSSTFDNVKHGDKKVVFIFLSVAVLILVIACINFMNLSTIRALERSKEVGLRKVMGALRNHLVWQFIGESILLTVVSCVLAVCLLQLLMPVYNGLLGYTITVSFMSPTLYIFISGIIILVGFLAGSYPAFFLSAFSPIQALKGKLKLGKGGAIFRQALVVVQFSISVFLIIGTIIIMKQMDFVKTKELGYDQEQTVLVKLDNNDIYDRRYSFKTELQRKNNISSVSLMSGEPGGFFDQYPFETDNPRYPILKARSEFTDFDFVKTLGLSIIAGRNFSPEFPTDTTEALIINHTAAVTMGYTPEQVIGKRLRNTFRDERKRTIVGVVEDFNFLSLKETMDALVIAPGKDNRVAAVKLKAADIPSAITTIKDVYKQVAPVYPFEYSFLDQNFDTLYKADLRQQTVFNIFSGLAIFIACLGLFGLASFTATKRLKEIGVRKVLGSSTSNIVLLLSKDLLKPVLLSTVIALPAGYYAMYTWLQNFAYRVPMHWWFFVLAALVTFVIAWITISLKALKAALTNPVKTLRTE